MTAKKKNGLNGPTQTNDGGTKGLTGPTKTGNLNGGLAGSSSTKTGSGTKETKEVKK